MNFKNYLIPKLNYFINYIIIYLIIHEFFIIYTSGHFKPEGMDKENDNF